MCTDPYAIGRRSLLYYPTGTNPHACGPTELYLVRTAVSRLGRPAAVQSWRSRQLAPLARHRLWGRAPASSCTISPLATL